MAYYVYVLRSVSSPRLYKGMTTNLTSRLDQHNRGLVRSTKAFTPWSIVYTEQFDSREVARKREKYLKSAAGRRFLKSVLTD